MKEEKKITLWRDEAHHARAKVNLEKARLACQRLLDEWNKLDLGTITNIDELQTNPEGCYKRALMAIIPNAEAPGRFPRKDDPVYLEYIATHDVPDPTALKKTATEIMKVLYCSVPGLFVTDGKTVTLEEAKSNFFTAMNDIVIPGNEPAKIALASKLHHLLGLWNELNEDCDQALFDSSSPVSNRFFNGKCAFVNTDQQGRFGSLEFEPEFLRRVLQV